VRSSFANASSGPSSTLNLQGGRRFRVPEAAAYSAQCARPACTRGTAAPRGRQDPKRGLHASPRRVGARCSGSTGARLHAAPAGARQSPADRRAACSEDGPAIQRHTCQAKRKRAGKSQNGGGGGGGGGVGGLGAPGGAGQAGAQVSEQRLDLVRAHGDRARQAQVILRLHQPALRGAAARSVFKGANVGVTWPAPVTVGARAWPTKGGGLLSLSGRMRQ